MYCSNAREFISFTPTQNIQTECLEEGYKKICRVIDNRNRRNVFTKKITFCPIYDITFVFPIKFLHDKINKTFEPICEFETSHLSTNVLVNAKFHLDFILRYRYFTEYKNNLNKYIFKLKNLERGSKMKHDILSVNIPYSKYSPNIEDRTKSIDTEENLEFRINSKLSSSVANKSEKIEELYYINDSFNDQLVSKTDLDNQLDMIVNNRNKYFTDYKRKNSWKFW